MQSEQNHIEKCLTLKEQAINLSSLLLFLYCLSLLKETVQTVVEGITSLYLHGVAQSLLHSGLRVQGHPEKAKGMICAVYTLMGACALAWLETT